MTTVFLASVLLRLLGSTPVPQYEGVVGRVSLVCVAFRASEVHLGAGRHAFACADALTGEILGSVLKRSGAIYCNLGGFYDASRACGTISGCGLSYSTC